MRYCARWWKEEKVLLFDDLASVKINFLLKTAIERKNFSQRFPSWKVSLKVEESLDLHSNKLQFLITGFLVLTFDKAFKQAFIDDQPGIFFQT